MLSGRTGSHSQGPRDVEDRARDLSLSTSTISRRSMATQSSLRAQEKLSSRGPPKLATRPSAGANLITKRTLIAVVVTSII